MTSVDYFRISAFCEPDDPGSYRKYSYFQKHTGLTDSLSIVGTVYNNDKCLAGIDREGIISQDGGLAGFNTYCNMNAETFWARPYSGSERFECVKSADLLIKVDEENTFTNV